MNIQPTSLKAYKEIRDSLGHKQAQVYNMLWFLESANNAILAKRLAWPINTVTPRVLELREKGLVIKDSMRICPLTKRMTWFWRVK